MSEQLEINDNNLELICLQNASAATFSGAMSSLAITKGMTYGLFNGLTSYVGISPDTVMQVHELCSTPSLFAAYVGVAGIITSMYFLSE